MIGMAVVRMNRDTLKILAVALVVAFASESMAEKKAESSKATPDKLAARKIAQQPDQSDSKEMKAFIGFATCREKMLAASGSEWLKCMDPFVVKAQFRKNAFARFLIGSEVTRARECASVDVDAARGFPGVTEHSICFEYLENGQIRMGIAFFVKSKGEPKLFSLYAFPH